MHDPSYPLPLTALTYHALLALADGDRHGYGIIKEVETKAEILQKKFKNRTIQKVLISGSKATKDLTASGYFYKIIKPESFLSP